MHGATLYDIYTQVRDITSRQLENRIIRDKKRLAEICSFFFQSMVILQRSDSERKDANIRNKQNLTFLNIIAWHVSLVTFVLFIRFFCLELWDMTFTR